VGTGSSIASPQKNKRFWSLDDCYLIFQWGFSVSRIYIQSVNNFNRDQILFSSYSAGLKDFQFLYSPKKIHTKYAPIQIKTTI